LELEEVSGIETLGAGWAACAEASRNVFATPEWLSLWRTHFAADLPLRVVACSDNGALRAVLPLYESSSGPITLLRFLGHGHSDELGPICAPAAREAAAVALRQTVESGGADLFIGDDLSGDFDWAGHLGGRSLERTESPVARLAGQSWDDFVSARSTKLRRRLRYYERALEPHGLQYRLATDAERLEADLDTLFALHAARWGESPWFAPARDFHQEFAALALERGWLRLWFLELDGKAVAAWLGYRFAGVEAHYQSGRDPAWDKSSVGIVLLAHTMREALVDGIEEYRFLRGGEDYKKRFATDDPGVVTVGRAMSVRGRAALAARTARRRVRRLIS
jgi:CelD/BcsL family acetyltransferase involved in cellulose biosynthesis